MFEESRKIRDLGLLSESSIANNESDKENNAQFTSNNVTETEIDQSLVQVHKQFQPNWSPASSDPKSIQVQAVSLSGSSSQLLQLNSTVPSSNDSSNLQ